MADSATDRTRANTCIMQLSCEHTFLKRNKRCKETQLSYSHCSVPGRATCSVAMHLHHICIVPHQNLWYRAPPVDAHRTQAHQPLSASFPLTFSQAQHSTKQTPVFQPCRSQSPGSLFPPSCGQQTQGSQHNSKRRLEIGGPPASQRTGTSVTETPNRSTPNSFPHHMGLPHPGW